MKVYSTITLLNHLNTQEAVIVKQHYQMMLLQLKILKKLKQLLLAMMIVTKLPLMPMPMKVN